MSIDLETAAKSAGLVNLDLLKTAKPGLPPADAVADLKRQYPAAFSRKVDAKSMTLAEYRAHCDQVLRDNEAAETAETKRRLAEFSAKLPPDGMRSMSCKEFKKAKDELLRICQ